MPLLFDSSRAHEDGAGGEEVEDREGRLGEHGEKMAGGEVSGTFWAGGGAYIQFACGEEARGQAHEALCAVIDLPESDDNHRLGAAAPPPR